MQRKRLGHLQCPIARSLDRVGEWWSMLILRDAFAGMTRFDQFQNSLGIAPNMLTRRLQALVEAGLLQRHRYCAHPPRDEYRLTVRGRDFRPILLAMLDWGTRHFAPEGASVLIVDARTGDVAEPMLVDRASGRPLLEPDFRLVPGPAAGAGMRQRLAAGAMRGLLIEAPDPRAAGGERVAGAAGRVGGTPGPPVPLAGRRRGSRYVG